MSMNLLLLQLRTRELGVACLFPSTPRIKTLPQLKPRQQPETFIWIPRVGHGKVKHESTQADVPSASVLRLFKNAGNVTFPLPMGFAPSQDTLVSISNRTFLELFMNAEKLFKRKDKQKVVKSSALEICYAWLCGCGAIDPKEKSQLCFNKKLRNIQEQYKASKARFNSRLDQVHGLQLDNFLEKTVIWHFDNKSGRCQQSSPSETVGSARRKVNCPQNVSSQTSADSRMTHERPSPAKFKLMEENRKLKRKAEVLDGCRAAAEERITELEKQVGVRSRDLRKEYETAQVARDQLKTKLKNSIPRTIHEKVVKKLKHDVTDSKYANIQLQQELNSLEDEVDNLHWKIASNSLEKRNIKRKLNRRNEKITTLTEKLEDAVRNFKTDQASSKLYYNRIISHFREEVARGQRNEADLRQEIEALQKLETQKGGVFLPHVRLMYYSLLTQGVSANSIQNVVRTVLEHATAFDNTVTVLPSRATAQRMVTEAGELVKIRTAYELARNGGSLGHHSDGTTKSMIHWGTHILKLDVGSSFTLTVSPVPSGKASDTISQLSDTMGELKRLAQDLQLDFDNETYGLSRISVRMSDRAATEGKVTKLLLEEKERMCEGAEDWETLSDGEKQERKAVRSFTCASHKINNTASAMTTASSKHLYGDAAGGRQLTGAQKLIYEVNKLICARGRKEYCDGMDFKLYCSVSEEISYEESAAHLMQPIVGNRYIVFLLNSVPVLLSRDVVQVYLEHIKEGKPLNRLEQSVAHSYLQPDVISELLAFALMFFYVCHPLLKKGKTCTTPLEMNWYYRTACMKLGEFAEDATGLLNGDSSLWRTEAHMAKDPFETYMVDVRALAAEDPRVIEILQVMALAGRKKLADHASEHLVGQFSNPSQHDIAAASLIGSATNDCVESCFGVLDREQRSCPIRNPLNTSAIVTAKKDKPVQFVAELPEPEKDKVVSLARKSAARLRKEQGTTMAQLTRLYQKAEGDKQEAIRIRRERLNRVQGKHDIVVRKLSAGNLLTDSAAIQHLKTAALNEQHQMWQTLHSVHPIQMPLLLKGFSTQKVAGKKMRLVQIIEDNRVYDFTLAFAELHVAVPAIPPPGNARQDDFSDSEEEDDANVGDINQCHFKSHLLSPFKFTLVAECVVVAFAGGEWFVGTVEELKSDEEAVVNYFHRKSDASFQLPQRPDRMSTDSASVFVSDVLMQPASYSARHLILSVATQEIDSVYQEFAAKYNIPQ